MKIAIVPAQITSVEDKIIGNLSFSQVMLLICPVFITAASFIFLPPFTSYKTYKLIISLLIATTCIALAVRVKNRLVIEWLSILIRYNSRPTLYLQSLPDPVKHQKDPRAIKPKTKTKAIKQQLLENPLDSQFQYLEQLLADQGARLRLTTTKSGDLRVNFK